MRSGQGEEADAPPTAPKTDSRLRAACRQAARRGGVVVSGEGAMIGSTEARTLEGRQGSVDSADITYEEGLLAGLL